MRALALGPNATAFDMFLSWLRASLLDARVKNDTLQGIPLFWSQGECQALSQTLAGIDRAKNDQAEYAARAAAHRRTESARAMVG